MRLALALAVTLLTAGCTFSSVKPTVMAPPPSQPARALVIGEVTVADPLWDPYKLHFSRGAEAWLKRNGGFLDVRQIAAGPAEAGSLVLVTRIIQLDKGSAWARLLVGMGAGQAQVRGAVEIQSADGQVLVRFESHESYLGGLGIGGAGLVDMEDLVKRFAETVAETTVKWSRGQPIQ